MISKAPFFTIFTPTYNRAALLPRAFESIETQGFRDFEWIVVDDGSTDETEALVRGWREQASYPIDYIRQANLGRYKAINCGIQLAKGELFVILDSDDWFAPNGLTILYEAWRAIEPGRRQKIAGIWALCAKPNGDLACSRYPRDEFDGNTIEIKSLHGFKGESCHAIRTDVRRAYLFPELADKYCPPSLVWNRIAVAHDMRFINRVVQFKEYQPEGLTRQGAVKIARYPNGFRLREMELLQVTNRKIPPRQRRQIMRGYIRASLHAGVGLISQVRETRDRLLWARSVADGVKLFWRDRWQARRRASASSAPPSSSND
ncbi:glycosyltransferase family A protein [Consotaella salsifontis]|uniref:Glycosyl transferase family 2 n=1 Tax=Consotaella salsifontis TaxID=1365950 RepID=A0A1T4R784_9HYPH|nr:glycosyltransferase family 2 protein [Consotaella salsifontis]SKA11930.1 Glycosyl transferase family 2 [Consotaella salsifontis]